MKDENSYIEWADQDSLIDIEAACRELATLAARMTYTKNERDFVTMLREIREMSDTLHMDTLSVLMEIGATLVDKETGETYDVNDVVIKKGQNDE